MHKKYRSKGLRILAFPANNFGNQEPGTNAEIKSFCRGKKVKFDMFEKISVAGDDQCPLYKYLTTHPDKSIAGKLKWNFEKYLVDRSGTVVARFGPRILPDSEEVTKAIENALAAKTG